MLTSFATPRGGAQGPSGGRAGPAMNHLHGITVLVLGLGESGLAMARWCARCGAGVRVWDSRETPPNAAALAEHVPAATLLSGALTDAAFADVRLVLKSPA